MALYKSAFSGEQIDEAIGAVRSKEATWDGKADAVHEHVVSDITDLRVSQPNLLHNWDFRNPVNQRGQTSYSGNIVYSIDRWQVLRNAVTLTVQSGYIQLAYPAGNIDHNSFSQEVENASSYVGKTITVSANIKNAGGGIKVGVRFASSGSGIAGTLISDAYSEVATSSGIISVTTAVPSGTVAMAVVIRLVGTVELYSAKLEVGSASTLANDPPADYGEQLALCQRYCLLLPDGTRSRLVDYQPNFVDVNFNVPVTMRVNPSIASGTFIIKAVSGGAEISGFTFASAVNAPAYFQLRATKTGHGLTDCFIQASGDVIMSADL